MVAFGLLALAPSRGQAQLAQRNTSAVRAPNVGFGAETFGGLEGTRDESGMLFAPPSAGDADMGEQALYLPQTGYDPLTASLQGLGLYTSNAGLSEENEAEDFYTYSEAALHYLPRITSNLFGDVSANYGLYRYTSDSSLDFNNLETSAGAIRIFPDLRNLAVWSRYNYTYLADAHDGHDELLTDHSLEAGLYFPVPMGKRHFAFGSYVSEFSLSGSPEFVRRNEHGITLGYAFLPTDKLNLSAYYQFFVYDFTERGRLDLLQDIGMAVEYKVTQNIDIRLQASYSFNQSNIEEGDYVVGEAGASLNLAFKF